MIRYRIICYGIRTRATGELIYDPGNHHIES
jgi:hypothetical protein